MSEIQKVDEQMSALFPTFQQVQEKKVNAMSGMAGAQVMLPVITLAYQAGLFMMGDQRMDSFEAEFIYGRFDLRRDYEKEYKEGAPIESPNCYSLDSKEGSRPPETRVYRGEEVQVYGRCEECYFSRFKTAGIWKGEAFVRGGPQCNRYALLFCTMNGNPVIVQVPPSGTSSIQNAMYQQASSRGAVPQMLRWRFLPTGGGKSKDYMNCVATAALDEESYNRNRKMFMEMWDSGMVQTIVERFVNPISRQDD